MLNTYALVLVCFGTFALSCVQVHKHDVMSAVGVSGGVVATRLAREGFDISLAIQLIYSL